MCRYGGAVGWPSDVDGGRWSSIPLFVLSSWDGLEVEGGFLLLFFRFLLETSLRPSISVHSGDSGLSLFLLRVCIRVEKSGRG